MKKKILVLLCNPEGTKSIGVLEETGLLQQAIEQSQYWERFDVILKPAMRFSHLGQDILKEQPRIIHFCGHGTNEGLILHHKNGTEELVKNKDLANLLSRFNDCIECVFLNACNSEPQG